MKKMILWTLLVCLQVQLGCVTQTAETGTAEIQLPRPAPGVETLLKEAGDCSVATIVLWPEHWATATQDAKKVLEKILVSLQVPVRDRSLAAPDALSFLLATLGSVVHQSIDVPVTVPGWDSSRPIVVSLFEPTTTFLDLAARVFTSHDCNEAIGFRHRLLIPSTDANALAAALKPLLPEFEPAAKPSTSPWFVLKGGSLHGFDGWMGFVAVVPERDHVRIEILTDDDLDTDVTEAIPLGKVHRAVSRWLRLLTRPARAAALLETPAMRFTASSEDQLAVIYLRSWKLRELGSFLNTKKIVNAVRFADSEERPSLFAMGMSEVFRGHLLMSPFGAEVDDLALAVSAQARITSVVSLTKIGARIYRAGTGEPTGDRVVFRQKCDLDVSEMVKAAVIPALLDGLKSLDKMGEVYRECGDPCTIDSSVRRPIGMLKALQKLSSVDVNTLVTRQGQEICTHRALLPAGAQTESQASQWTIAGRVVVGETFILVPDQAQPPLTPMPRYEDLDWPSPSGPGEPTREARCLMEMILEVSRALEKVAYATGEEKCRILSGLRKEQEKNLACVSQDPDLRDEARGIMSLLDILHRKPSETP